MEIQTKRTIKAGNSSAVILPKSWLNKKVRVELIDKTPETILLEAINILKKYIELKSIIGVYLAGSYARNEEDKDSDIDILIVTDNLDREMIHEGIYNILLISQELLNQKLTKDLFPIGQMLKESKPLLNSKYLDSIKIKITRKNTEWYIKTTKDKLKIVRKLLEKVKHKNKKYLSDVVAYTLVLRIRTLHIIEKLINEEDYSKRDFIKIIKRICRGTNAYERYLAVKNNFKDENKTSIEEAERLYEYLKNQLKEIRKFM